MNFRSGAAATGLVFGGLGIAAAVAVVTAPITPRLAVARTIDNGATWAKPTASGDGLVRTARTTSNGE